MTKEKGDRKGTPSRSNPKGIAPTAGSRAGPGLPAGDSALELRPLHSSCSRREHAGCMGCAGSIEWLAGHDGRAAGGNRTAKMPGGGLMAEGKLVNTSGRNTLKRFSGCYDTSCHCGVGSKGRFSGDRSWQGQAAC